MPERVTHRLVVKVVPNGVEALHKGTDYNKCAEIVKYLFELISVIQQKNRLSLLFLLSAQ
jgi:hypothetical protein